MEFMKAVMLNGDIKSVGQKVGDKLGWMWYKLNCCQSKR